MSPKPFLHEQIDFKDLLLVVSEREGILPQLIEKDYWLMHSLWALDNQGLKFELKGGTSLSKGWKIIERFSEDVDIKILPPTEMDVPTGKNQSKPKHREKREKFFDWLEATIQVPGTVGIKRDAMFDDHDLRNAGLRINYPTLFPSPGIMKEGILLEVGFDITAPNESLLISSWAYDFAISAKLDLEDNRARGVPCYFPEYTLVEKLSAISKKYRQEVAGNDVLNFTRHYYDVYQLLGQQRVQDFIGTKSYYQHKERRFQQSDVANIAINPAFTLSDPAIRKRYDDRYKSSADLYFSGQPPLEAIIERIQKNASKL